MPEMQSSHFWSLVLADMKIKILSLNCWLLPPPFSVNNRERLQKIIELIRKINPHIVALQEVWLNKYVSLLKKEFSDYFAVSLNKGLLNKTGLVTLSKLKPDSVDFCFFKKTKYYSLVESFGKKGYQKISFTAGSKKFVFINTHLYDPLKGSKEKITAEQFNEIKNNCKDKNLILAGDLNIKESDFTLLNSGFFYNKQYKKINRCVLNKYQKIRFNRFEEYNNNVDYILPKQKNNKRLEFKIKIIKLPIISDHFPIEATLNL
jgi:endonuclease/exonuclease/phosphatase family metal-dependent hydrolase